VYTHIYIHIYGHLSVMIAFLFLNNNYINNSNVGFTRRESDGLVKIRHVSSRLNLLRVISESSENASWRAEGLSVLGCASKEIRTFVSRRVTCLAMNQNQCIVASHKLWFVLNHINSCIDAYRVKM
jgi:hypothetical protein